MSIRSFLVLVPTVAIVGLTACSVDTSEPEETKIGTQQQAFCTIASFCDTNPLDLQYSCKCGEIGPNGGFLSWDPNTNRCKEGTKLCCPSPKTGGYCPPSYTISYYNPCYYPKPYFRCNNLGDCWCSAY